MLSLLDLEGLRSTTMVAARLTNEIVATAMKTLLSLCDVQTFRAVELSAALREALPRLQ
jgi:hypothetical protein